MWRWQSVLVGLWLLATPAVVAEPAGIDAADRAAIRATIERQLAAFGRDDEQGAYALASPGIRAQFETAPKFMAMVRTGYQPVYRPRAVRFGDVIDWQGRPTQRVFVTGPDGRSYVAYYPMERQPDDSWLIAGCALVEVEGETI